MVLFFFFILALSITLAVLRGAPGLRELGDSTEL